MVLSPLCFNAKQINKFNFDYIIVGSDEVWNFKDSKGNAPIKFGMGFDCKNLITYAPSVGKVSADEKLPEYVIKGIKKFKAISARYDLIYELAQKITGKTLIRVLDPTFMGAFKRQNYR